MPMNRPFHSLSAFALLLVAAFMTRGIEAQEEQDRSTRRATGRVKVEADGPEQIRERVRLYLQRHGDNGRLDPEALRKRVAADYAARQTEKTREQTPFAVGGSNWVSIGPTNGAGRMTAIAPHPTVSGTLLVGAAGGGVWKTTDGGTLWTPLTDSINDLSVGALAIAPSSPNMVYLGSGEGGYAIDFIPGIGLLTSTDGGTTWAMPASVIATTFYRISVHPSNPLDLVVGTNQGGLRSTNGGASWSTVIPRATYGDVTDIVRDPTNPSILYAAGWGAKGSASFASKVLKSTDGGTSWAEKSVGFPLPADLGGFFFSARLSLAISPSSPNVLYAATDIYDSATGSSISHIYKSTNGCDSWADLPAVSASANDYIKQFLGRQSWYNNTLVVSPTDPNVLFAGGTFYIRTTDGGSTFAEPSGSSYPHVDAHDLRYQGSTLYVANDGGIWSSTDNGVTFTDRNTSLVTRQLYAIANDPVNRNRVLSGAQDNGTSRRGDAGGMSWTPVLGADGFECGVNPLAPTIAYGTSQYATIYRTKDAGNSNPSYSEVTPPFPSDEGRAFLSILTIDPSAPATIYTGSIRVWQSLTGGDSWMPLPTATTDSSTWTTYYGISSIAVAPSNGAILMAGQGSKVFRSTNTGTTWVSYSLPSGINNLEIDRLNPNIAYAALATTSGQSLYRTTDGGVSWTSRSSGLPSFAAQVVRVDPTDSNVLYCGTDVGVYRSTEQGGTWTKFGTGLPNSSVQDLRILDDASILRVATHGRGVWELQVPSTGNTPPAAVITSPVSSQMVAKGSTLTFSGSVSDPDVGDTVTGLWTFTDTWGMTATPAGPTSVSHTFRQAGVFPISLAARDSHGALGNAFVSVSVREPADNCATPLVLPGSGPFPYTVIVNNETASTQASDPIPSCEGRNGGNSLWFELTPTVSGTYEFSTCGGSVDTVLSVYTGAACGSYTEVACNNNAGSGTVCQGTSQSVVAAAATAGQTLRIQVTGYSSWDVGTIPLTVRPTTVPNSAPRVIGLSKTSGSTSGGTAVTVLGASFANGATVNFGGTSAGSVTFISSTMLGVTTPAHVAGSVDVVVRNPDTTSGNLGAGFAYVSSVPTATVSGGGAIFPGQSGSVRADLTGTSPWSLTWSDGVSQSGITATPVTRIVSPVATTVYTVTAVSDFYGAGTSSGSATVTVSGTPPSAARFYSLFPCRLFDTRNTTGPDAASPALAPGETRLFTIGGRCSLPSSARSLSVNQTVTGQTASGELVLYRGDLSATPTASSITFQAGKTRANNGILDLARDGSGTFKVFNNSTGSVHFILDVNGCFQ